MNQASRTLRRTESGFAHWCPGCEEPHSLPKSWSFNGDLERPTFTPSFKHSGIRRVFANGKWTGEWLRDAAGNTVPYTCHYILSSGELQFCGDCTHALVGKTVPLPPLPEGLTDDDL